MFMIIYMHTYNSCFYLGQLFAAKLVSSLNNTINIWKNTRTEKSKLDVYIGKGSLSSGNPH